MYHLSLMQTRKIRSISTSKKIIQPVHANMPIISKFKRHKFNSRPIPYCMPPRISAMTPTLNAKDIPADRLASMLGRNKGKYTRRIS